VSRESAEAVVVSEFRSAVATAIAAKPATITPRRMILARAGPDGRPVAADSETGPSTGSIGGISLWGMSGQFQRVYRFAVTSV
jgi:hypothetical protein